MNTVLIIFGSLFYLFALIALIETLVSLFIGLKDINCTIGIVSIIGAFISGLIFIFLLVFTQIFNSL